MNTQIPEKIYEWSIHLDGQKRHFVDFLRESLTQMGFRPEEIVEHSHKSQIILSIYLNSVSQAQQLTSSFKKNGFDSSILQLKTLQKDDWLTRWKESWKPFILTPSLEVVPSWQKEKYVPKKQDYIVLDTVASFGTGLHETTRFMARFIEHCKGSFESFLDIGTGTGILAIVALKCKAKQVICIDISSMSITTAKANLTANGYRRIPVQKADIKKWRSSNPFDYVAANLLTQDLIEFKKQIIAVVKPGGFLAVSGISLGHLELFKKEFEELPLDICRTLKGKQWAAVLYKKKVK